VRKHTISRWLAPLLISASLLFVWSFVGAQQQPIAGTVLILDAPDYGVRGRDVDVVALVKNNTLVSKEYRAKLQLNTVAFSGTMPSIEASPNAGFATLCIPDDPSQPYCEVEFFGSTSPGASLAITVEATLGVTATERLNWAHLFIMEGAPSHYVERSIEVEKFAPLCPVCPSTERVQNTLLESPDLAQTGSTIQMVAQFVNFSDREILYHPHSWVSREVMPQGLASYELSVPHDGPMEPQECDEFGCSWWPSFTLGPRATAWMTVTITVANEELVNVEAWTIEGEPTEQTFVMFAKRFISLLRQLPTVPTNTPTKTAVPPLKYNFLPLVRNGEPEPTPTLALPQPTPAK
jgi:hypothetical protein